MKNKIIIYGASGHGKVIADIIEKNEREVIGFIDDDNTKWGELLYGYKILGGIDTLLKLNNSNNISLIIGIGDNSIRKKIAETLKKHFFEFEHFFHPSVEIARGVDCKAGTVVMGNSIINSDTTIGKHCIINTSASVDHDCIIGDYVHISPGVHLGGNVEIGDSSWIGLGASVINNIKIGKNSIIGSGAVIIRDVPDNVLVVGIPAKVIKKIPYKILDKL